MMTFDELEQAITIGTNLEAEGQKHSSLLYNVGLGAARASANADDFEYELELVYAEVQEEIRTAANNSGEKVTEALVASRIKASEKYQKKHDEFRELQRRAGEWKALLRAYESRGHSLRDLTVLATRQDVSSGMMEYGEQRAALAAARAARNTPTPNPAPKHDKPASDLGAGSSNARRRINLRG